MWHMVALAAISLVDGMNKKRAAKRAEDAANSAYAMQKARLQKEADRYNTEVRDPIRQELNNLAMNKLSSRGSANDDEIARQFGNLRRRAIQNGAPAGSDLAMTLKEMSVRQGNANEDEAYKQQRKDNLRANLAQMSPAERQLAELDGQTAQREERNAARTSAEADDSFKSGVMAMAQAGSAWGQANKALDKMIWVGPDRPKPKDPNNPNPAKDPKDPSQYDDENKARY